MGCGGQACSCLGFEQVLWAWERRVPCPNPHGESSSHPLVVPLRHGPALEGQGYGLAPFLKLDPFKG